jgi:hypothetical protein
VLATFNISPEVDSVTGKEKYPDVVMSGGVVSYVLPFFPISAALVEIINPW